MKIKVGKSYWRVYVVKDIQDALDAASGCTVRRISKDVVGYTDVQHKVIFLQKKRSAEQLASTYFHELLHAACPDLSEKRVYHIERCLFRLLWRDGWRPSCLYRA